MVFATIELCNTKAPRFEWCTTPTSIMLELEILSHLLQRDAKSALHTAVVTRHLGRAVII